MPESAQPGSEWLEVYSSATGDKQVVPARWMDHPSLSKGLRKTPLTKAREASKTPVANNDTPAAGDKEK